jgi:flagellar operon protein
VLQHNPIPPAAAGTNAGINPSAASERRERPPFDAALEKAFHDADVKLSRHARERMQSRRIELKSEDVGRISQAIDTLRGKGASISLLLMGDTTLVTNVNNRTVITAIDRYGESNRVFTQIDSAAVIEKA